MLTAVGQPTARAGSVDQHPADEKTIQPMAVHWTPGALSVRPAHTQMLLKASEGEQLFSTAIAECSARCKDACLSKSLHTERGLYCKLAKLNQSCRRLFG